MLLQLTDNCLWVRAALDYHERVGTFFEGVATVVALHAVGVGFSGGLDAFSKQAINRNLGLRRRSRSNDCTAVIKNSLTFYLFRKG